MLSRKRRSISSKNEEEPTQMDNSTPKQSPVRANSSTCLAVSMTASMRKKRKLDSIELCQTLYDSIRNLKKEDGSMLCDTFIRAPKRRQEPSYYDVVINPIDLLKIQQKLKTDIYDDLDEVMQDFELLVNNAKAFYKSDSMEYQDAVALWLHVTTNKQRILETVDMVDEETNNKRAQRRLTGAVDGENRDDDVNIYEEAFAFVMAAMDTTMNERPLHRMFLPLPSKKVYPDYYDVIEHPIDLRLIATKIQANAYSSLQEMERDLLQMTKNACQCNEPGSQLYKDAQTLIKMFTQKRLELEMGIYKPTKRPKALHIATIAALKEEVDSSDEEETSKKCECPMWTLFDHLYNATGFSEHPGATGPPLGSSLWKLPIRRFHPQYFELIKRPSSMSQIHTKLDKAEYANISELTADLYLMLDNAKKAYPVTHRTHKDAVKMLKLLNAKLVEDTLNQETSEMEEEDEEDDDEEITKTDQKKKGRPRANNSTTNTTTLNESSTTTINSPKALRIAINAAPRKAVLALHKYLLEFSLGTRKPIELFMDKPPRKVYPDYYGIIQNPIDMITIEHNIRMEKYRDVDDIASDYRLMFAHCRQYNEEGSNIYKDANVLEKALSEKLKEFPSLNEIEKPLQKLNEPGRSRGNAMPITDKLWQFYESMRDFQDPKGKRQLSLIFTKLSSKTEYPDYYDIIKEPMDMERIATKLKQGLYETVDDLAADFLLMLENAFKYNEPNSQIYKDALVLQQMAIQLKQSLRGDSDTVPDVGLAVQELLMTLFTALYNHQDGAGRCYWDSLLELPEYDDLPGDQKVRGISMDVVKRRLYKGVYKRLDVVQEDIFSCLETARKLSRTDSDVFQDSIELQTFFIKKRDEVCQDTLSSPALSYDMNRLLAEVELIKKQQKITQEEHDQDQEDKEAKAAAVMQGESVIINQIVFSPGDFVFFQQNENKIPSIAYIERLWTTEDNIKMMHGAVFLRPHETYHVQTMKFMDREVFKSSVSQTIPMDRIIGKCYIMHIRDFIKSRPENVDDKDLFVCESHYNIRARSFRKFKIWPYVRENDPVNFIIREKPIEIKRVMSVFKERVEKHKSELDELKMQEALVEKEKPNVPCDPPPNAEANAVYYQQFNTICSGVVKTGDFVYVTTETGKQSIAQIHQIYERNYKSYFKGPWLLAPNETILPLHMQPPMGKQLYRQALLLSTVQETSPVIAIVGRCAVLEYQEYISSRPTEFLESDVYICEASYDELKKSLHTFGAPITIRKFQHSPEVTQDEILYFKTPVQHLKDIKTQDLNESLGIMEDSMDGNPSSVSLDIATTSSPAPSLSSTPLTSNKSKTAKKSLTGYILYSREHRKGICDANPNASFGDISRMVGKGWNNLPSSVKQAWKDRAVRVSEESAAKQSLNDDTMKCASPGSSLDAQNTFIFECCWDKCDYQFEDSEDCMEHCLGDITGHVQRTTAQQTDPEYSCIWRNCIRVQMNIQAFPSLNRLIKHVRELHLSKCGKSIAIHNRGKNYVPRKNKAGYSMVNAQMTSTSTMVPNPTHSPRGGMDQNVQIQFHHQQIVIPPPEPMFVTVPPHPQQVKVVQKSEHDVTKIELGNSLPEDITRQDDESDTSVRQKNSSETTPGNASTASTPSFRPSPPNGTSKCQSRQSELTNSILQSVNEHLKQPKLQEDRFDIFGKNVAIKLRDLPRETRVLTEKIINDALFDAEMGTLTPSHKVLVPP